MNNIPEVKVGIVAVSRDCFPESLSVNRRKALVDAYSKKYDATRWSCTWEISDRRFPRHCWQSILTVRKCLLLQQRREKTTWSRDAEMLIAVC